MQLWSHNIFTSPKSMQALPRRKTTECYGAMRRSKYINFSNKRKQDAVTKELRINNHLIVTVQMTGTSSELTAKKHNKRQLLSCLPCPLLRGSLTSQKEAASHLYSQPVGSGLTSKALHLHPTAVTLSSSSGKWLPTSYVRQLEIQLRLLPSLGRIF